MEALGFWREGQVAGVDVAGRQVRRLGEVGTGHPGADSWNFHALQLRV